jgi:hypothetical protein
MIDELQRDYMDVHVAYPTVLTFSYCMPIIQLKLIFLLQLKGLEKLHTCILGEKQLSLRKVFELMQPTIYKFINSGTRWQMHILIGTEICAKFEA